MLGTLGMMVRRGRTRSAVGVGCAALLALATACSGSDDGKDDASSGDDDTTAPSGDFTLLSYNVAGLPQEISTVNPKDHIPLISPLLDDYDVVVTQEDFDWWKPMLDGLDFVNYHERLRAKATHPHKSAQYPGPEAAGVKLADRPDLQVGDGLGFLSRFAFTGEARVPWAGCFGGYTGPGAADCLSSKGFAMVRLELADGVTVDLYTLHAEAGGSTTDQQLQVDDFAQLTAYMADHSEGRAIIVGGDTNLHTNSDHPDASGDADTEIWAQFLKDVELTDACDATSCPESDSIDKIAYRSATGVTLKATDHEFPTDRFQDPSGTNLSDHLPLVVTFHWATN